MNFQQLGAGNRPDLSKITYSGRCAPACVAQTNFDHLTASHPVTEFWIWLSAKAFLVIIRLGVTLHFVSLTPGYDGVGLQPTVTVEHQVKLTVDLG